MNDMELAEEIERHISHRPSGFVIPPYQLYEADAKQIIAALRRVPDEIDAAYALRMVYLMLRSLRAEIPPGRSSMLDRDRLRNEVLDEVEARVGEMQASENLRSERPPFGEMVERIVRIVLQLGYNHWLRNGTAIKVEDAPLVLLDVRPALSAAEAEGRKG